MIDNMVGEYMVRSVKVASPDMTVDDALTFIQELRIRHLPVVRDRRLVGLVSERDLLAARARNAKVAEVMAKRVYVARSTTPVSQVAAEMADNKYGSAVIVDPQNHVLGIFTTTDALRIIAALDELDPVLSYMMEDEDWIAEEEFDDQEFAAR